MRGQRSAARGLKGATGACSAIDTGSSDIRSAYRRNQPTLPTAAEQRIRDGTQSTRRASATIPLPLPENRLCRTWNGRTPTVMTMDIVLPDGCNQRPDPADWSSLDSPNFSDVLASRLRTDSRRYARGQPYNCTRSGAKPAVLSLPLSSSGE